MNETNKDTMFQLTIQFVTGHKQAEKNILFGAVHLIYREKHVCELYYNKIKLCNRKQTLRNSSLLWDK